MKSLQQYLIEMSDRDESAEMKKLGFKKSVKNNKIVYTIKYENYDIEIYQCSSHGKPGWSVNIDGKPYIDAFSNEYFVWSPTVAWNDVKFHIDVDM